MGSSRLPRKTLADLSGKPLLQRVIERVQRAGSIDSLVLATTTEPEDGELVEMAERLNVVSYRGSPNDVLDRFHGAALANQADIIVRLTADDPFKDPDLIEDVVGALTEADNADYASNSLRPTYPEGLDVEVFTFNALDTAWREATLLSEREHVTPYIWARPERFRLLSVENESDLSHLRWTVDYAEDLEFARRVYQRLGPGDAFGWKEVLEAVRKEPDLAASSPSQRNEGYYASVQSEASETGGT